MRQIYYNTYRCALRTIQSYCFSLVPADYAEPRNNVSPSQIIPVIRAPLGTRELSFLRWGLIPHWTVNDSNKINKKGAAIKCRIMAIR